MTNKGTTIFVIIIVALGFVIAGGYIWWRSASESIDGYYTVTDGFIDSTTNVSASVSFVKVVRYDSLMLLRVAEHLTRDAIEHNKVNSAKKRDFLYHFYVQGDTAALTDGVLDELAYTHPNLSSPAEKLVSVPGGWVIRAQFAPRSIHPQSVKTSRTAFYMPRPGVKALDLR